MCLVFSGPFSVFPILENYFAQSSNLKRPVMVFNGEVYRINYRTNYRMIYQMVF